VSFPIEHDGFFGGGSRRVLRKERSIELRLLRFDKLLMPLVRVVEPPSGGPSASRFSLSPKKTP